MVFLQLHGSNIGKDLDYTFMEMYGMRRFTHMQIEAKWDRSHREMETGKSTNKQQEILKKNKNKLILLSFLIAHVNSLNFLAHFFVWLF